MTRREHPRDEGTAIMFALMFIVLGSMMILPLLNYTSSVMRSGGVQERKMNRSEAVRGALRMVLADPAHLFTACGGDATHPGAGLHNELVLAAPAHDDFKLDLKVVCTTLSEATEASDADLRMSMATVAVGSTIPSGTVGSAWIDSGNPDPSLWWGQAQNTSAGGKIFVPYLPTHGLNHPTASGYMMPSWVGSCRVFFPGTYLDPITITDATPTFFTSGVYYFENTVTFGANAKVVVGEGAIEGCTTNAEAAFYAINAPATISISGIGATFVFGAAGRMVVTDGGQATGPDVKFNARLVDPTDVGNTVTQGVSLISVNGVQLGVATSTDLDVGGYLRVPQSLTETNPTDAIPPVDAASTNYHPSTLVPAASPAPEVTPIISVSFTGTGTSTLYVPGYVSVPQGRVDINLGAGAGVNKSVQLLGGVLAAKVTQTADLPADLQMGVVNRIVQKTFKLVAETLSGSPHVTSIAIVQINDYGEYAINTWVTTT